MQIYLPIAELPVNVLVVLAMGAAVGFVSGLFGIGGGFLMTPLLIFLGIPHAVAVATETAQIAATSVTGAISYQRRRAVDFKLGGVLVAAGFVGTLLGVWFFNVMRRIGQLETVISLSYIVLLGGIGGLMLFESARAMLRKRQGYAAPLKRGARPWWFGLPLRMRFHRSKLYMSVIPIAVLAMLISFAGAVLGIGGGFILVPALIYLFGVPTAIVVGTSLFQILWTMLAAVVLHAVTNQSVDIVLAILLTVGGVLGVQAGARMGQRLTGESFRLLLALLILLVAARFASDIIGAPAEPFSLGPMERRE